MAELHSSPRHTAGINRTKPSSQPNRKIILLVIAVMAIIAIVWWIAAYSRPQGERDLANAKSSVGRHILLPTDEEPTLAKVTDKSKLTSKFLAAKADNGDLVLVYTQNQLVVVYRPSIDRIVAVSGVTADSALAESQKATVTVLDGANDSAKTQKIVDKLKTTYPDMQVTNGGTAARHDFKTTIVIDNTGEKDYLTDALARLTGGSRGVVPISEAKVSTDLMIIVGTDSK